MDPYEQAELMRELFGWIVYPAFYDQQGMQLDGVGMLFSVASS